MKQESVMYYESQGSLSFLCGLHSLNNLVGEQLYSKDQLNNICYSFSNQFINPHKHILGGDYDINVLMKALKDQGYECKWIDKRQPFKQQHKQIIGYLLNRQMPSKFFQRLFKFSNRHWIAVRKWKGAYYVIDSKLAPPVKIAQQVISEFMDNQLKNNSEIIQVYPRTDNEYQQELTKTGMID